MRKFKLISLFLLFVATFAVASSGIPDRTPSEKPATVKTIVFSDRSGLAKPEIVFKSTTDFVVEDGNATAVPTVQAPVIQTPVVQVPETDKDSILTTYNGEVVPPDWLFGTPSQQASVTPTPVSDTPKHNLSPEEINLLASVAETEAGGLDEYHRSLVVWTVFNRLDSGNSWYGDSVTAVVTKPYQYAHGKNPSESTIRVVCDVACRWAGEQLTGQVDTGRTLPKEFTSFNASNGINVFYGLTGGLSGERFHFSPPRDSSNAPVNPYRDGQWVA